jgi:hypothetical protein
VLVLYDGSRSMYPGYKVGQHASPRPAYFHERMEFVHWLLDFLAKQGDRFGATDLQLSAFTNEGSGLHVKLLPLRHFQSTGFVADAAQASDATTVFQPLKDSFANDGTGMKTYLLQALDKATANFEGIVWMVTDNIAEGLSGPDIRDCNALFAHLRDTQRYRAVHVFAYPYDIDGKKGALAVYGFLVSPQPPDQQILEYHDKIFFELKQYFPRQEHLKLKDLHTQPLDTELDCSGNVVGDLHYLHQSGQALHVSYTAGVSSLLTQHTVMSGNCSVAVGEFYPSQEAAAAYGLTQMPAGWLPTQQLALQQIEPGGSVTLTGKLVSNGEIPLPGMDAAAARAWAASGKPITYTGKFRITFSNLVIHFEPQRLEEIYGMSRALNIFDINSQEASLPDQTVTIEKTIQIAPPPPPHDGWVMPSLLLLLAAVLLAILFLLLRPATYQVTVGGVASLFRLRPFGSYRVRQSDLSLGVVRRNLGKDFSFTPGRGHPLVQVDMGDTPATWRAVIANPPEENKIVPIVLEGLTGGKAKAGGRGGPSRPAGPGGQRRSTASGPPPQVPRRG